MPKQVTVNGVRLTSMAVSLIDVVAGTGQIQATYTLVNHTTDKGQDVWLDVQGGVGSAVVGLGPTDTIPSGLEALVTQIVAQEDLSLSQGDHVWNMQGVQLA